VAVRSYQQNSFENASKTKGELINRILYTLFVLAAYYILSHVSLDLKLMPLGEPFKHSFSITASAYSDMLTSIPQQHNLGTFSLFSLGLFPYIMASIIMLPISFFFPHADEKARKKRNQWTRGLAVILTALLIIVISSEEGPPTSGYILPPLLLFFSTSLLMIMGEKVSERGVGNGISLIIAAYLIAKIIFATGGLFLATIVFLSALAPVVFKLVLFLSRIRRSIAALYIAIIFSIVGYIAYEFQLAQGATDNILLFKDFDYYAACIITVTFASLALFYWLESSARFNPRIKVIYANIKNGRKLYGGRQSHIPLKWSTSGFIPYVFAETAFALIAIYFPTFLPDDLYYRVFIQLMLILIFYLCYERSFLSAKEHTSNLEKHGGLIPGEPNTYAYLKRIFTGVYIQSALLTTALFTLALAVPEILNIMFGFDHLTKDNVTLLKIPVMALFITFVFCDTITQIQTNLISLHYEGLIKKGKSRTERKQKKHHEK
jgi:preprotein translocase subunit SecY